MCSLEDVKSGNSCQEYKDLIRISVETHKSQYLVMIAADDEYKEKNWTYLKEKLVLENLEVLIKQKMKITETESLVDFYERILLDIKEEIKVYEKLLNGRLKRCGI